MFVYNFKFTNKTNVSYFTTDIINRNTNIMNNDVDLNDGDDDDDDERDSRAGTDKSQELRVSEWKTPSPVRIA